MTRKVALVTGASSGFGRLTAAELARQGFRVFGTSRKAGAAMPEGVEGLVLDVTSDASVAACVEALLVRAGRIDLLVNNAGQIHASFIEETALEQARDVFETNFWGVVRVTSAVLPAMRGRGGGHIVNVSSLAGLTGVAGQGFYSASKFALEGYSETLSIEVARFGIHVTLVEPGFFKTSLHYSMARGENRLEAYAPLREGVEEAIESAISTAPEPDVVARTIARIAGERRPPLRRRVGTDAVWVPRMKAILPERIFRQGMLHRFKLDAA